MVEFNHGGNVSAITYASQEAERKQQFKIEQEDFYKTAKLDAISRVLFPTGFFAFNLYFWLYFDQEE